MTAKGHLILYIGADEGYFRGLGPRFQAMLPGADLTFKALPAATNASAVSKYFLQILAQNPSIIYIDFSTYLDEHTRLALLVRRDNSTSDIPIVGLVEHHKFARSCRASGVQFVHIKCGEFHDVVYDPCYLAFPGKVKPGAFARARANIGVDLIEDFRVGYLTKDYMHVEGNLRLNKGDRITLGSSIPSDMLPSKNFVVREVSTRNLYYDYRYGTDLNYLYLDPPEFNESEIADGLGEEDEAKRAKLIKEAKQKHREAQIEFESKLKRTIKKFNSWIDDNTDRSLPKETKILIVDPVMDLLKDNEKRLDAFPYTIRFQTILSEELNEIERTLPNILALHFYDSRPVAALDARKTQMDLLEYEKEREELINSLEDEAIATLGRVFKKIASLSDYAPIVTIFGCESYTSKAFQESFKYPLIITHKHSFNLEMVIEMAELFERKQKEKFTRTTEAKILELRKQDPIKNGRLTLSDFIEKRYYISKSSDLSFASYSRPVTLETLTESELTLVCEEELTLGVYRFEKPISISLTLVNFPDGKVFESSGGALKRYRALIHCAGEEEKKELRRFVNEVFSAPKKERETKEKEAFDVLNAQVLAHRELEEKKQKEAHAKELAEKLSKKKIN